MSKDSLGDRMKTYESVPALRLMRRVPVILRVDGKAFHTLTRDCVKPYDTRFAAAMHATARYLCQQIQGAVLAYVQSDEISVLITDYAELTTDAWFGYQVQKMVSIGAATASVAFNSYYPDVEFEVFDARVFNLSREEVTNYFVWRQQDATRNSINAAGQALLSHAELQGKNTNQVQDMLFTRGVNWNDYPSAQKRGVCVTKQSVLRFGDDATAIRTAWVIDSEIPVFTTNRSYIETLL